MEDTMNQPLAVALTIAAANVLALAFYYSVMAIVAWRSPDALAHMGPLHPIRRLPFGCRHSEPTANPSGDGGE